MSKSQDHSHYVIFETSQKWGYHATAVVTTEELKKIIQTELCDILDDLGESQLEFDDIIDELVRFGTNLVYKDCSSGIVSVVRLSDGKIWGDSAKLDFAHNGPIKKEEKPIYQLILNKPEASTF